MTPQDFASYASSACAILMVIGSMGLLYKGIITLGKADTKSAMTVEFKKHIKVTSHYPALALFLVGWIFLLVPMFLNNEINTPDEVQVDGNILIIPSSDIGKVTVRVLGGPWDLTPDTDGSLNQTLYPNLRKMRLEVSAPGRPTIVKTVKVDESGRIMLGPVQVPASLVDLDSMLIVTGDTALDTGVTP